MLKGCPWRSFPLTPAVVSTPSLLSDDERQHLAWLARTRYSGWGEIVDLGAFLGSSAVCLATGAAERLKAPIKSYDVFQNAALPPDLAVRPEFRCAAGSFLPDFLSNLGSLRTYVEARVGDLLTMHWDGGPIELMHIDVWKSWELTAHVIREFFPHLRPGSIIVHQDIKFQHGDWIQIAMGRLRDFFAPLTVDVFPSTMAFELIKPIPPELLEADYSEKSRWTPDVETHFDWLLSMLEGPSDRALIDGSRLYHLLATGQSRRSLALHDLCLATYPEWCYRYFIRTVFACNSNWDAVLSKHLPSPAPIG